MEFKDRIIRDLGICGGEGVVAGARFTIRTILANLAEGDSIADLVGFPLRSVKRTWRP